MGKRGKVVECVKHLQRSQVEKEKGKEFVERSQQVYERNFDGFRLPDGVTVRL